MEMTYEQVLAMITADVNVIRVLRLEKNEDWWLYCVETRHTFPRFVIGRVRSVESDPEILVSCGAEWNAEDRWAEFTGGISR